MAQSLKPYLNCIRATLDAALCLENFGCQNVERYNKPEVEARAGELGPSKEVLLNPVTITRNETERCLIEASINSVRISVCIKQADEIETLLTKKFTRFLMQRAESFVILRRKPVTDYDISFLITNTHLEGLIKSKLIDFIIKFLEDVDKEISDMKISVNTRGRDVAREFLKEFAL